MPPDVLHDVMCSVSVSPDLFATPQCLYATCSAHCCIRACRFALAYAQSVSALTCAESSASQRTSNVQLSGFRSEADSLGASALGVSNASRPGEPRVKPNGSGGGGGGGEAAASASTLESYRESLRIAAEIDWSSIDPANLTQFPGARFGLPLKQYYMFVFGSTFASSFASVSISTVLSASGLHSAL